MRPGDTVALSGGVGRVLATDGARVLVSPGVLGVEGSWRPYGPARWVAVKTLRRGHWTRAELERIVALRVMGKVWSEVAEAIGRPAKTCQYLYRLWEQG